MNRNEWLDLRKKGIGGSDASALLGLNPYMTNEELWEIKTGRKEQDDISDKPYVKYGVDAEPLLIDLFKLDFPNIKVEHKDFDLIVNDKHDFLIASLDGRLIDEHGRRGVLEIKTSTLRNAKDFEKWTGQVPINYYCQVLHYLMVTNADFAILKAHLKIELSDSKEIKTKHYFFEKSDLIEEINHLKQKEIEFWNEYIIKDKRPPVILPEL